MKEMGIGSENVVKVKNVYDECRNVGCRKDVQYKKNLIPSRSNFCRLCLYSLLTIAMNSLNLDPYVNPNIFQSNSLSIQMVLNILAIKQGNVT